MAWSNLTAYIFWPEKSAAQKRADAKRAAERRADRAVAKAKRAAELRALYAKKQELAARAELLGVPVAQLEAAEKAKQVERETKEKQAKADAARAAGVAARSRAEMIAQAQMAFDQDLLAWHETHNQQQQPAAGGRGCRDARGRDQGHRGGGRAGRGAGTPSGPGRRQAPAPGHAGDGQADPPRCPSGSKADPPGGGRQEADRRPGRQTVGPTPGGHPGGHGPDHAGCFTTWRCVH